jgi:acetyl-CoA acyltransferase
MDLVEMHEAFAAQVLANLKVWESDKLCKDLGLEGAIGEVDMDTFNVHGGSIPIGHPFGATGARMATTMHNELHLQRASRAVLGLCAAGGLGAALLLERLEG